MSRKPAHLRPNETSLKSSRQITDELRFAVPVRCECGRRLGDLLSAEIPYDTYRDWVVPHLERGDYAVGPPCLSDTKMSGNASFDESPSGEIRYAFTCPHCRSRRILRSDRVDVAFWKAVDGNLSEILLGVDV